MTDFDDAEEIDLTEDDSDLEDDEPLELDALDGEDDDDF